MTKDRLHKKVRIQLILSQVATLRRELRETLHAFEARLEIKLAEVAHEFAALKTAKRFPKEQLNQIDSVIVLLRNRKSRPEKGRRKDLRKIEKLINDLHVTARPPFD
jgi:hypothetical protein